ncbi:MAG: hypothetical protein D6800_00795 [Candidatus Zixiibacteriota bacterium]|nr:MAG: hypothetical protein D6800_00795 [candidate division Zixibacteria bacterium]
MKKRIDTRFRTTVGLLAIAIVSCACLLGCGDSGTGPQPPVAKDYPVYFYNGANPNAYYEYRTLSGTLDSFMLPFVPGFDRMTVSSDGALLYVSARDGIHVVTLATREETTVLPFTDYRAVAVSPDGRWLAVQNGGLDILNRGGGDIILHLNDTTYDGLFATNSDAFYCLTGDMLNEPVHVLRVPVDTSVDTVTRTYFPSGRPEKLVVSPDERTWYLFLRHGVSSYSFVAYDAAGDSMLFIDTLAAAAGDIVMTPDGGQVLYSLPGSPLYGWGPPVVRVYTRAQNAIRELSLRAVVSGTDTLDIRPWQMVVTPDSRRVICSGANLSDDGLLTLAAPDWDIERHAPIPQVDVRGLTIQQQL